MSKSTNVLATGLTILGVMSMNISAATQLKSASSYLDGNYTESMLLYAVVPDKPRFLAEMILF